MKKSLIQFAFTNPFFGLITYILYPIISLWINILPLIQKLIFLHFLSKLFLFLTKILFLKNIKINFQYTYWEKMHTKKCGLPNKQTFHLINVVCKHIDYCILKVFFNRTLWSEYYSYSLWQYVKPTIIIIIYIKFLQRNVHSLYIFSQFNFSSCQIT